MGRLFRKYGSLDVLQFVGPPLPVGGKALPYLYLHLFSADNKYSCLAFSSTLKMQATCSSETSADFKRTKRHYIPQERILLNYRCENLKSYNKEFFIYFNCKWVLPGGSGTIIRRNSQITHFTSLHFTSFLGDFPHAFTSPCLSLS
jgi:hypothetical protein